MLWIPEKAQDEGWGYCDASKMEEEFAERYAALAGELLGAEGVYALCYTQLYDVEQEKNGLYTYAREKKLSDFVYRRIREVNTRKVAIEG